MKIAIDLRSLQSGGVSGVENYALNLTQALLRLDRQNSYVLFYNSLRQNPLPADFHFVNAKTVETRIPNKFLNVAFKARMVKLEQLTGPFDVLFMPNANQVAVRKGAKLAVTVHDLSPVLTPEFYDLKRTIWHRFIGFPGLFRRADALFAVSEHTKNDLIRLYKIAPEKITVAYPGIDPAAFRPDVPVSAQREVRNKYGLPGRFILFLNTLEPRKNAANLIRAFDLVQSPVHLVLAGKRGWKSGPIEKQIERSKKKRKIVQLGYVDEAEKPALIKLSEVVAYPSLYEGFGFQPLEAAACGVPVLASQVSSIPEVIGDAALLVNPYNVQDIATGLEMLLEDEALRTALVEKGLKRAQEFRWEKTAQTVLNTIHRLV